jgi:hypothetical protein
MVGNKYMVVGTNLLLWEKIYGCEKKSVNVNTRTWEQKQTSVIGTN